MSDLKLVIGDKNTSTWSLCTWLTLKQLGLEFEEVVIARGLPDARERILRYSPSGRLPLLVAGGIKVWDSLAINEFLADHFDGLWPASAAARAVARSVAAEAHSGFRDLYTFLPMDVTARFGPPGRLLSGVAADLRRLAEIVRECRERFGEGGPFLVGEFSIADAMLAPVCARMMTHAVPLDEPCRAYVGHMASLPAMLEWAEGAAAEVTPPPSAADDAPRAAIARETRRAGAVDTDRDEEGEHLGEERSREAAASEAGEVETEADAPPAPGLPGIVATRRYTGGREEAGPADREPEAPPRRRVRPPVPSGLAPRWMPPPPPPSVAPPARNAVADKPVAAAPEAAAATAPAPTFAPIRPAAPPPPPVAAPTPEPPPRPAEAPVVVRRIAPAQSPQPSPAAAPAQPAAAGPTVPERDEEPAAPVRPPTPRPVFRPGTIKPIGDGTRRRR